MDMTTGHRKVEVDTEGTVVTAGVTAAVVTAVLVAAIMLGVVLMAAVLELLPSAGG